MNKNNLLFFCILFLLGTLSGCSQEHTHTIGSYISLDKNNHTLLCDDCGEKYSTEPHQFESESVEGNCLEENYTIYTCKLCNYSYQETGSKGEHTFDGTYVKSDSYHWSKCSVCGEIFNQENHNFVFEKHVTEPTCESKGIDLYKCSICGYEKKDEINALEHDWEVKLSYDRNAHWETCSRCGEKRNRKNHSLDDGIVTLEPTCIHEGAIEYRCDDCGVVIEESIPKLNHDIDENAYLHDEENHWNECSICHEKFNLVKHDFLITEQMEASHFNAGKEDKICKFCGYEVHIDFPKLNHVPDGDYRYDEESHWNVCKDDGEILDKEIHDLKFIENTIEPTCLEGGEALYECSVCGYQENHLLDPLGHDYQYKYNSTKHWQECTRCHETLGCSMHVFDNGLYDENEQITLYTCNECGYKTSSLSITVTWKNQDGTILETDTVTYGSMPSYDGPTPEKEADFSFEYTFVGWTPEVGLAISDVEYIAVYQAVECSEFIIDYEALGGENAPLEQTKQKGVDISLSDVIPTKDGYVFLGRNNKFEDKIYQPGDLFSLNGNVTLYAMWAEICPECNGSQTITSQKDCSYCSGGRISYYYCSHCNKKTSVTVINGIGTICNTCGFIASLKSETCSYCNGKGYISHINDCETCAGRGYLLPNSPTLVSCEPRSVELQSVEGCEYSLDGITWQDSNVFENLSPNTQYNFYQRTKTNFKLPFGLTSNSLVVTTPSDTNYFVYYVLNGGTNNSANPSEYRANCGQISLNEPTKTHFAFVGWSLNGEIVDSIDTSLNQDIVLEALWTPSDIYTGTFDSNGGNLDKCSVNISYWNGCKDNYTKELNYGEQLVLSTLEVPDKDGYIFGGWYLDSDYLIEAREEMPIVSDINLYAKMVPLSNIFSSKYETPFVIQSGKYSSDLLSYSVMTSSNETASNSEVFVTAGNVKSITFSMSTHAEYGISLTITDLTTGTTIFSRSGEIDRSTQEIDVEPLHAYRVKISSTGWDDGSMGGRYFHNAGGGVDIYSVSYLPQVAKVENSQTYYYGEAINLPNLEREGYNFLGWFDENNQPVHSTYDYDSDMTFHAEWEEIN